MCKLNLVTLQCVSVKLLSMLLFKKNRVWHFADGPLTCLSDASAFRSMYFIQSGGKLVLRKPRL